MTDNDTTECSAFPPRSLAKKNIPLSLSGSVLGHFIRDPRRKDKGADDNMYAELRYSPKNSLYAPIALTRLSAETGIYAFLKGYHQSGRQTTSYTSEDKGSYQARARRCFDLVGWSGLSMESWKWRTLMQARSRLST